MSYSCSDPYEPQGHHAPPTIIAHRGASDAAPENTLPAVKKAWELGADGVEVDVRVTKDDRIVAIHDKNTGRTSDRKFLVQRSSYDSLVKLDAGSWFDPSFEGTRIPLLNELLDHVPASKELVIEIKSGPVTVELLEELLAERVAIPRFSIISFDPRVIEKAKATFPKIPVHWVLRGTGKLEKRIAQAKDLGVNGLNFQHRNLDPKKVDKIKEAGLHVLCWTVNDTGRAKALKQMGVEAITTDRPQKVGESLEE